tara:strand:- start:196 stop:864 length:669 start_codon:yes stop_codon:yes gene_type:complete
MPSKPLAILAKCFRLITCVNRNDLAKLSATRLPRDSGYSIEFWNTGERISTSDKLMGANARAKKTAYAVSAIKYHNAQSKSTNVLPRVIYNPLTAATRARRDIDVARNFFAALARRGEVRLIEVDPPEIVVAVPPPPPRSPLKSKKPVIAIQVESEQQQQVDIKENDNDEDDWETYADNLDEQNQADIKENDNDEDDWETYADNLDEIATGREVLRQQIETS